MSFASILGPSNNEPSPKMSEAKQTPARPVTPPPKPVEVDQPVVEKPVTIPETTPSRSIVNGEPKPQLKMETVPVQKKHVPPPPPRTKATNQELEKISKVLIGIDESNFSDVEDNGWTENMQQYQQRRRKRAASVLEGELQKRKVSTQILPHPNT